MKRHNLAFLDIETTGLDPEKHEIIEIGVVVVRQALNPDGSPSLEVIDELEYKVKPERIQDADPRALRVNGYNPSDWVFAYTLEEAMKALSEKTKDAIFVAHNVTFDYSFIERAFRTTGVENKMHYHKMDTISIAFALLHKKDDIERFSLQKLTQYFGVENKKSHTALSDARATYEVYKKLMSL
ncbi:hypothetical protein COB64_01720 [Candidatus Wolfebacteria bacterium]|nr:MAG: hypothetical protein COB64_01720 [Candidatus Wolfebacteria bacterium]